MYAILTNLFFDQEGEIQCDRNRPFNSVFGVFERREDAEKVAELMDRLWVEAVREWNAASESWKPLTEHQAYARPSVEHIDSLPEWA